MVISTSEIHEVTLSEDVQLKAYKLVTVREPLKVSSRYSYTPLPYRLLLTTLLIHPLEENRVGVGCLSEHWAGWLWTTPFLNVPANAFVMSIQIHKVCSGGMVQTRVWGIGPIRSWSTWVLFMPWDQVSYTKRCHPSLLHERALFRMINMFNEVKKVQIQACWLLLHSLEIENFVSKFGWY
jgi:hypothetical protein